MRKKLNLEKRVREIASNFNNTEPTVDEGSNRKKSLKANSSQGIDRFELDLNGITSLSKDIDEINNSRITQILSTKNGGKIKWTVSVDPNAEKFNLLLKKGFVEVKKSPDIYNAKIKGSLMFISHIEGYIFTLSSFQVDAGILLDIFSDALQETTGHEKQGEEIPSRKIERPEGRLTDLQADLKKSKEEIRSLRTENLKQKEALDGIETRYKELKIEKEEEELDRRSSAEKEKGQTTASGPQNEKLLKEIDVLRAECEISRDVLEKTVEQSQELENEKEGFIKEISDLESQLDATSKERDDIKAQFVKIRDLEPRLNDITNENRRLKEELNTTKKAIEQLQQASKGDQGINSQIEELKKQNQDIEQEREDLKQKLNSSLESIKENEVLRAEFENIKEQASSLEERNLRIKAELQENEAKYSAIINENEYLKKREALLLKERDEFKELLDKKRDSESQIENLNTENIRLKDELKITTATIEKLQQVSKATDEDNRGINSELEQLNIQNQALEKEREGLKQKLNSSLESLKENEVIRAEFENVKEQASGFEERNLRINAELKENEDKYSNIINENEDLKMRVALLTRAVDGFKKVLDKKGDLESLIENLDTENKGLKEELKTTVATTEKLQRSSQDIVKENQGISSEIEQLKTQNQALEQERDGLTLKLNSNLQTISENDALKIELKNIKDQTATLEGNNLKISAELKENEAKFSNVIREMDDLSSKLKEAQKQTEIYNMEKNKILELKVKLEKVRQNSVHLEKEDLQTRNTIDDMGFSMVQKDNEIEKLKKELSKKNWSVELEQHLGLLRILVVEKRSIEKLLQDISASKDLDRTLKERIYSKNLDQINRQISEIEKLIGD